MFVKVDCAFKCRQGVYLKACYFHVIQIKIYLHLPIHSLTLSQTVVQREEYEVSSCNDSTVFFLFECQKSGAFV